MPKKLTVQVYYKRRIKIDKRYTIADFVIIIVMIFIATITLYPFLNVLAISFNDVADSVKGGIYLWPRVFTFRNYQEVFSEKMLLTAFKNSILRTLLGAALGVVSTAMIAYVLSRKDFIARKVFSVLFAITLYVGGGMIPDYLLIKRLGLINKFGVYILPGLIGVFYIYIIRSFIDELPYSLQESAQIDGASDLTIFFRIIFPLCKPAVATIALYYAVAHWNSWFDTYLYASGNKSLTTLQFELMKILNSSNASTAAKTFSHRNLKPGSTISPESIRMAITIVATVPILVVYPFLQKYFVQGLTLGAVKN